MKKGIQAGLVCILTTVLVMGCMPLAAVAAQAFDVLSGHSSITMALYETYPMTVSGVSAGTAVTWTSSDESVVFVDDAEQFIVAKKPGTARVTAVTATGEADTVTITVADPLVWNGVGTKTVLVNQTYSTRTFALTVAEDGVYEIYSDNDLLLAAVLFEGDEPVATSESGIDLNETCSLVHRLYADTTYYLHTYCDNISNLGGTAYELTVEKSTRFAQDGVYFLSDTIATAVGDQLTPQFVTVPFSMEEHGGCTMTSSDPSVVQVDGMAAYALNAGTATLTIRDEGTGATDTVEVTVSSPRTLSRGTNRVTSLDPNVYMEAYVFTADIDDTFCFRSQGASYIAAMLYDTEGNAKAVGESVVGEFYLNTPMGTGDMVVLYVVYLDKSESISLLVGKRSYPSIVSLSIPEDFSAKMSGETYVLYAGAQIYLKSDFGKTIGCQAMDVTYTFGDPLMVEDIGNGVYNLTKAGATTATVTTSNGLTDSLSMNVIEYILGDVGQDGTRNMVDAMTIYSGISGNSVLTDTQKALTDYNGDNVVNMVDTFLLYGIISGKTPTEDTQPDSGTVDPTPGDDIEDNWE